MWPSCPLSRVFSDLPDVHAFPSRSQDFIPDSFITGKKVDIGFAAAVSAFSTLLGVGLIIGLTACWCR